MRGEKSTRGGSALSTCVRHTPGCRGWGGAADAPKGLSQGLSAADPLLLPNTEP